MKRQRKARDGALSEKTGIRGMFRVQLEEDGTIVADTGWKENQITNLGFNWYLCGLIGGIAGSSQVGYAALGTGGAPAATENTLAGEISGSTKRQAVTAATSSTSKTVHFTGTFNSANSFVTTTTNLSNIGLFASTGTANTLFAGNVYNQSIACQTNQNVNFTYDIIFS